MKRKDIQKNLVLDLLFIQNLTIKEAAAKIGCTKIMLQRFMRDENIKFPRYSKETKEQIFKLLDTTNKTHQQIANEMNMTLTQVRSIIKQRQATIRFNNSLKASNKINLDIFDEKNKWLFWYLCGIITTDGHIRYSSKRNFSKTIVIFQNDHKYLTTLQELLQHQGKIYVKMEPYRIYQLQITDPKLWSYFYNNDLYGDKRYTTQLLNCPKECLQYYLRGVFDGDGCIWYQYISGRFEGTKIQITSGSKLFAEQLSKLLNDLNFSTSIAIKTSQVGHQYYDINILKKDGVLRFCEFIYRDHLELKLEKKYIKYLKFIKLIELDKQFNDIVDSSTKVEGNVTI